MTHHNEQEAIGGFEADTIMGRVTERPKVATYAEGSSLNAGSIPAASQLNEAVKRIAELDAKRTQGEWFVNQYTNYAGFSIHPLTGGFGCITERWEEGATDKRRIAMFENAAFIAAAPLMAATVAQQAAIIEQQRAVLVQAREALWVAHENSKLWNGDNYNVTIQTGDSLTAIDKVLGA